jgi:cytochrome c biogenesis protein
MQRRTFLSTKNSGFLQSLWDFFCSLKLAISLIITLAVTSIFGTIIKQGGTMEELQREYSAGTIKLFSSLDLFDMYHSWWFILLLYLFTVNLTACSIKRLPRVWKLATEPTPLLESGLEKSLSNIYAFTAKESTPQIKERMVSFLKTNFGAPEVTERDGEIHLFVNKTPYSRLGVYVVHLSIIVVFIGAILGSLFGYKAYVNIPEGGETDKVYTRAEKEIPLGFKLRCDKFTVTLYDTGAPKEFRSLLTVLDNGQEVIKQRATIVNDPLTYKGITFYQSSYGPAGDATFHLTARSRKGALTVPLTLRQGELAKLTDGSRIQVVESTQEVGQMMPGFSGPAARIEYTPVGKEPQTFVIFKNFPNFDEQRGGDMIFTYDASDAKFFTGLQVAKDPGVGVVWLGCALMVIGICIAFFMSHKRVWIRIVGTRVVMGGSASKNPAGFGIIFDGLAEKLKQAEKL